MELLRIMVIGTDGQEIGVRRAALRLVAMILGAVPFFAGFVSAFSDEHRQAWHDKIAGTYVFESRARNRGLSWFWDLTIGEEKWLPEPFAVTPQKRWPTAHVVLLAGAMTLLALRVIVPSFSGRP